LADGDCFEERADLCRLYSLHWKNLSAVSLTFVNNLSPVLLTPAITSSLIPVRNNQKSLKFIVGVNDTAKKLITGVNDTANKFLGGVNGTSH
jgi:hypothetical protein